MNDEILYNIGLLIDHGATYDEAVIFAIDFYMDDSKQETINATIH